MVTQNGGIRVQSRNADVMIVRFELWSFNKQYWTPVDGGRTRYRFRVLGRRFERSSPQRFTPHLIECDKEIHLEPHSGERVQFWTLFHSTLSGKVSPVYVAERPHTWWENILLTVDEWR